MQDDKRNIRLSEINRSELLKEVIRAYMHGALPSALISCVASGLDAFLRDDALSAEDREFIMQFRLAIDTMHKEWRAREDSTYG